MTPFMPIRLVELSLLILTFASSVSAQSFLAELNLEHDPARRSELALTYAAELFDSARDLYHKGEIEKADAELESMTKALNACIDSLAVANKARFYKKAELRVAALQRRLAGVTENLDIQERGWAEYTGRKLEEIHDKLLNGVMRK
jgi:hypothetical protein